MKSLAIAVTLAAVALLVPSEARAQAGGYITSSQTQAYTPLSGATTIPLSVTTGGLTYGTGDDGYTVVPIGFDFTYFGSVYTHLGISTNGLIFLLPNATATNSCSGSDQSTCRTPTNLPTTASTMKNFIAGWWDDLDGRSGGTLRYTTATDEIAVEYSNWDYYFAPSGSGPFNFIIRFKQSQSATANDIIQIHYGSHGAGSGNAATQAGVQNATTTAWPLFSGCGNTTRCTEANWPANTLYTILAPIDPELEVQSVTASAFSVTSGNASFNFSATVKNIGQQDANNWFYKVYLSTDKVISANDVIAFDSSTGSATSLAANATTTITGTGTATNLAVGNYYVLFEADSAKTVTEALESNNNQSSLVTYTVGVDLVATSLSGAPANTGPGNAVALTANISNPGSQSAGTVNYSVVVSVDQQFSTSDFVAYTGTVTLNAGQTIAAHPINFNLPANTPGGSLYFGLMLDPSNTISESAETNNAAFAATPSSIVQADLDTTAFELYDPVTGQVSHSSYMGDQREARVTVRNIGGATASGFSIGFILSKDKTLSLQPVGTDYTFVDCPSSIGGGNTLAAGATATYTCLITMPSTDKLVGGQPLQTGDYYIFAKADSFEEISELSEGNNTRLISFPSTTINPVRLFVQAPDLAVTKVQVPTATAVGEVVPVYRAIRNIGILDAPALPYRYYASANDLITEDDIPLEILKSDGTTTTTIDITLAKGAVDTNTDFVRLPAGMPPGTYFIGAVVDPQNTVTELDEVNNQLGSSSTIVVAAPAMRVTTSQIPDAVVDRPYVFQLTVAGTGSAATWVATNLPGGLTVDANKGLITGTPTTSGIYAFDVTASAGGRNATARLVMRVLENTSELAVTTLNLPPIVNNIAVPYTATLAAAGGTKPYTWKIVPGTGTLPTGITLRADGVVSGTASGAAVGESRITFEVTDSTGTRARQSVKIRIVAQGSVMIDTLLLPNGIVNSDYITDLTAKAAGGGTLQRPLNWSVSSGSLPEGLILTTQAGDRGIIQGKPFVPGTYLFSLQVEDAFGRTDSADYVLRVYSSTFKVFSSAVPAEMHPGDNVTFNMSSGSGFKTTYELYSGALPPGLTMDEAGVISGTIDEDAEKSVGSYNIVVTAKDANGGTGMGAVYMEVTRRPVEQGCSATGSDGKPSLGALALLAIAGLFAARRSRAVSGLVAAVAVALVPATSFAQSYSVAGPTAVTYTPLVAPTVISATTSGGVVVNLPFPFKYYGTQYTTVGVAALGYLEFSGADLTEWSNRPIPHSSSSYPSLGIAVWWDDIETTTGSQISYKTLGTAPNREFVIEWKDVIYWLTTGKFSFQVHLYEGTSRIKMVYGGAIPTNASASVGIMGGLGIGVPGLACASTGACTTSSFPTNKELEFSLPADLTIPTLSGDDTGYANVSYRAQATIANVGGTVASQAKARFYLSTNGTWDTSDTVLGDSAAVTLNPNTSQTVLVQGMIPASTTPGSYFILAKADPDNTLTEPDETNNVAAPFPITVGQPAPDVQPLSVSTTSSTAVPGQTLTINRTFFNGGNAPITGVVKYTYFLSDNQVASYSDFAFTPAGSFTGLTAGAANSTPADTVTLPNDLPAGRYWIGVCADYDSTATPTSSIQEISEVNNCLTASTPFVVSSGTLTVLTTDLPGASQYAPYSVRLDATGGNGVYSWSLNAGSPPPGMTVTSNGFVQGTPSTAGTFSFEVKVTSGTDTKTQALSLAVTPANIPLAVVDQDLPTAEFGKAYLARLVAIGGKPPYTWTLKSESIIPPGIAVASDGLVEGRTSSLGDYLLAVEVQDSAGVRAAREVKLSVSNPTQLAIKTSRLVTAYVGKSYNQPLEAVGGQPQYAWRIERFQQLAQGPTDIPQAPLPEMPATFGLIIYSDPARQGAVALDGIPTQAGLYALTLRVRDGRGNEDVTTLTLLVSYDQALQLNTTALPDAFVGRPYTVRLSSNAPANTAVTFTQACVQQVAQDLQSFVCATADERQQLPPGLIMGADGTISGTPNAPGTFDGKTAAIYSFLVKVSDTQGRYDVRSLSIKLQPNYEEKTGCAAAGSAAPMLLAAMGALSLLRRRRK